MGIKLRPCNTYTSELTSVACFSDKATNPLNKETDWENIKSFCDQLNNEPDGWDHSNNDLNYLKIHSFFSPPHSQKSDVISNNVAY